MIAQQAQADPKPPEAAQTIARPRYFAIPPQPLASAVEAYAQQTGIQILYDAPPDPKTLSPGVSGWMIPTAALEQLLVGTGLLPSSAGPDAMVLIRIPALGKGAETMAISPVGNRAKSSTVLVLDTVHVAVPPRRPLVPYRYYAAVIESRLVAALRKDRETAGRRYSIGLDLWVNESGRIGRAGVQTSTGDRALDKAVLRVATGLTLGSAPPNMMPQPVQVRVEVTL